MKNKWWLLLLVLMILLPGRPVWSDDGFYVVGGGGVGTKITSLPYPINNPGLYYLARNLTAASGNGITVNVDEVTIDLMGFCLTGPGAGKGISMVGRKNVEIRNGTVSNWASGVLEELNSGSGHRLINLRVVKSTTNAIQLAGSSHVIKGCLAQCTSQTGTKGIRADDAAITGCIATNCRSGLDVGSGVISGCVVTNCGWGISCTGEVSGCSVVNCTVMGIQNYNGVTSGNQVDWCYYGIHATGNIINNSVTADSGQVGINIPNADPTLVDQNTVQGDGTPYVGNTGAVKTDHNAGF